MTFPFLRGTLLLYLIAIVFLADATSGEKFEGEKDELLITIQIKLESLKSKYESHGLTKMEGDIGKCEEMIGYMESLDKSSEKYQETYEKLLVYYDKIEYADLILESLEIAKEKQSSRYFVLWDRVYALKNRVDRLYTKTEKSGSMALSISSETTSYRKKNIYAAYNNLYDHYLGRLKGVSPCEYMDRIDVLMTMQGFLKMSEELLKESDTKDFEKDLRRIDSSEEIILVFSAHPLGQGINW